MQPNLDGDLNMVLVAQKYQFSLQQKQANGPNPKDSEYSRHLDNHSISNSTLKSISLTGAVTIYVYFSMCFQNVSNMIGALQKKRGTKRTWTQSAFSSFYSKGLYSFTLGELNYKMSSI